MGKASNKHASCLRFLFKYFQISVVLTLSLCKPALAEDVSATEDWLSGFKLGGYSSATVIAHSSGHTEAALNEVSFLIGWEGNSHFRFFSELEIERPATWNEYRRYSYEEQHFDLERLYLDYSLSEKVNLRAGRFLTPAGIWNLLHAAPLVWTSTRPLATSQLFPVAVNGLMVYGAVPLENLGLEYSVYIETLKDQLRDDDETLFKDVHGARLTLTGEINVGLTMMEFKERIDNTPQFRMIGLDFVTHYKDWEFSGEGFQRYYSNGGNGGSGAYLQTAIPLGGDWYGLARVETFQRPQQGSADRWLVGAAWRAAPKQILKMEVVGGDEVRPDAPKGFLASYSILF